MDKFKNLDKPYYVYVLIDPSDYKVFYVGKGKGRRSEEHEKSVRNGTEINELKDGKIKEIFIRNDNVMDRVIGRFKTESEALAVESTLIKWVYGLENLTNSVHGHKHNRIRTIGNIKIIKGLDIEKNIFPGDHAFSKDLEIDAERYDIYEKLLYLRKQLLSFNPNLEISMPDFQKKKDPAIFVRINKYCRLQLMMRTNGHDSVIRNIRAIEMNRACNQKFLAKYENSYDLKMKTSNDSYFKFDDWKSEKAPHFKNNIGLIIRSVYDVIAELN